MFILTLLIVNEIFHILTTAKHDSVLYKVKWLIVYTLT